MEVHPVLDGVHPVRDRRLAAVEPLGVRGHLEAHSVGLVDERRELGLGELDRVGVLELVRACARRHHLDEVGTGADLLAHGAAHVVRPVRLSVHVAVEAATRRRRRNDLSAGEQPWAPEGPVTHRLAGLLRAQSLGADDPDRGDALAKAIAELRLQEVRRRPRQHLLGAAERRGRMAGGVRVSVDEPRQNHAAFEVDGTLAPLGHGSEALTDGADHAILDEDRCPLADLVAGAVEKAGVGEPEPFARRWRRCD